MRGSSHLLSPFGISPNGLYDWHGNGEKGQTVFAGNDVGRTVEDGFAPMGSMPNHVKFAAKAGDCIIFDLATYHTAQPNTSKLERWNTIQGYHSASIAGSHGTPTGPIMSDARAHATCRSFHLTSVLSPGFLLTGSDCVRLTGDASEARNCREADADEAEDPEHAG